MKRLNILRAKAGGYTIVETLIVFAASSALVLSVMILISGQQGKTQFTQAIRDADSRLADFVNDYSTGYYVRGNDLHCLADNSGGSPSIDSLIAVEQGANVSCAYVGTLITSQLGTSTYSNYTIVGRQFVAAPLSQPTSDFPTSKPVISPLLTSEDDFSGSIELKTIRYTDSGGLVHDAGGFGVISSFSSSGGGGLVSDKQTPQLLILKNSYASNAILEATFSADIATGAYEINRPLTLCFKSGTSNQNAVITMGTNGGASFTTNVVIGNGPCS